MRLPGMANERQEALAREAAKDLRRYVQGMCGVGKKGRKLKLTSKSGGGSLNDRLMLTTPFKEDEAVPVSSIWLRRRPGCAPEILVRTKKGWQVLGEIGGRSSIQWTAHGIRRGRVLK